jgi:hypothetical protein
MVKEVTLKTSESKSPVWLAMSDKYISINEVQRISKMQYYEADEVVCEITLDRKMAGELLGRLHGWMRETRNVKT